MGEFAVQWLERQELHTPRDVAIKQEVLALVAHLTQGACSLNQTRLLFALTIGIVQDYHEQSHPIWYLHRQQQQQKAG
jgi:hypothetical protein